MSIIVITAKMLTAMRFLPSEDLGPGAGSVSVSSSSDDED